MSKMRTIEGLSNIRTKHFRWLFHRHLHSPQIGVREFRSICVIFGIFRVHFFLIYSEYSENPLENLLEFRAQAPFDCVVQVFCAIVSLWKLKNAKYVRA